MRKIHKCATQLEIEISGKFVPLYAMKANRGRRAPPIHNPGTRWRRV